MGITSLFRSKKRSAPLTAATEIDLSSPEFFQDPYPIYKKLRQAKAIPLVKPAGHLVTRYEDIELILASSDMRNSPSRFSALHSSNADKYVAASLAENILPFMDSPESTLPRQCLIRSVHSQIGELQASLPSIAENRLESYFFSQGNEDLISGFASPYALEVMCSFLGFPLTDGPRYKELSEAFFYLFAPISDAKNFERVNQTLSDFRSELESLAQLRKQNPQNDLISKLLDANHEGKSMSLQQVVDSSLLVFADGVENVEAGIANVLAAYFNDAEAMNMFANQEINISTIVSEGLRLQTPAQFIPRILTRDTEICGQHLDAESPIFLSLASANRDAERFDNPDKILPNRSARDILTFGRGAHSCIGGRLASMQISTAMEKILATHLIPKVPLQQLSYKPRLAHRWPESYPMVQSK